MRHPNGWGTVARLSGNRRRPFVVRKTKGWDDRGYPEYLTIGYFETREQGLIALAEFNKAPYDVDAQKTTLEELFALWEEKKAHKLGTSSRQSLKSAYKHCKALYRMKYRDIRSFHMQDTIDNCGKSYSTQGAIKALWAHLDRFALELDIINKSYAQLTAAAPVPETSKRPFTDDEVAAIWKSQNQKWVDSVLVFLYSGWRISELLELTCENVDLTAGTMRGGTKTKAGKDRVVPIHSRIVEVVKRRYDEGGEYLFEYNGKKVSNSQYYALWNEIMEAHGMTHTPHECRHTFRSRLDSAGANKVCIDRIMGHVNKDTGERIYTHKTLQELKDAIEMIKD